jgi:hypothetical protein
MEKIYYFRDFNCINKKTLYCPLKKINQRNNMSVTTRIIEHTALERAYHNALNCIVIKDDNGAFKQLIYTVNQILEPIGHMLS